MGFKAKHIPDQTNKVAIVTGANTGIGYITALEIARKGGHVILACRSQDKTLPKIEEIKKETGNERVEFMKLDLGSFSSILTFVEEFRRKNLPLHTLINNAGVMFGQFSLTEDGIENQIGTNHFGHALLTLSLLDIIEQSQPSRIVFLSSMGHTVAYPEGVIFDHINDPAYYTPLSAYGQSKLCNILFSSYLSSKLEGKQVYVNSVHPGWVATELKRNVSSTWGSFANLLISFGESILALTPEKGALTTLYVATSQDIENLNCRGQFFVPIAKKSTANSKGVDVELQKKLWDFTFKVLSEKLGDRFQPKIQP